MLTSMRATASVLLCLACIGHGRRLNAPSPHQSTEQASNPSEALTTLLLGDNDAASRQAAFNAAAVRRAAPASGRIASSRMAAPATEVKAATEAGKKEPEEPAIQYSEALPFLVRRASLGPVGKYAGDVGFDPVGFTEVFPIEWMREAELKHCRVAMLAFLGFAFTDFYHLPGFDYSTVQAHDACVAQGSMSQLLLWIGLLEVISAVSIDQMLRGSGREPGDFGFDPMGFATDEKKMKELQMKELANGRLAMFAFGGAVTQAVLTGNTFPWLYGDATTFGGGGDFAWNIVP